MRNIELASWENVPNRVDSIKRSLEIIYKVRLHCDFDDVPLKQLYPTEDFLENDKLALILMKVVKEGYDVPVITVDCGEEHFVLDGHHRSYVHKKLMDDSIKAYVLKFPEGTNYRAVPKHSIEDLPIKIVGTIDDLILKAWQRIFSILKHYEAIYEVHFYLKKDQVYLSDIVPTQSQVRKARIDSIKELLVPIVCIKYQGIYYILDGHARSIRAGQLGSASTEAIILPPSVPIDFGVVKTTREMNLRSLDDVKIVE
jgi:hypothetical protein